MDMCVWSDETNVFKLVWAFPTTPQKKKRGIHPIFLGWDELESRHVLH